MGDEDGKFGGLFFRARVLVGRTDDDTWISYEVFWGVAALGYGIYLD
jgi:hypothetical protein